METTYAEPMQAVKKTMGLPKGISPQPVQAPVANTPGTIPSPMGAPRINPYEYGPNAPPEYRAPLRQTRGFGSGYTGWDPRTEMPADRTIPRSRFQQPEQYRTPGFKPTATSKITGQQFGPQNIRIPTTSPKYVEYTGGRGMPKANPYVIGGLIAWETLKPRPTSDGTLPDFSLPLPDVPPQPEPGSQTSICGQDCVSGIDYGRNGKSGFVYQYSIIEVADYPDFSGGSSRGPKPWSRSLGIAKIVSDGYPDNFYRGTGIIKEYKGLQGKETYTDNDGIDYVRYSYWIQNRGRISPTGRKWWGTIGVWVGDPRRKDSDTGPNASTDGMDFGFYKALPSRAVAFYNCRVGFCNDSVDTDPTDPNDYKREEDDKVACKWKTENDQDVDQLEIREFTYKKFVGCNYDNAGNPKFFEDDTIQAPKGFGQNLVAILETQGKMMAQLCELPVPVPVVPDWMPLKWANVPKLVVLYAEERDGKKQPAKYQITIPHWSKSKQETTSSYFTSYTKGQYQMIYEMFDGSKITINCQSEGWCNGVMQALLGGVNPTYGNLPLPGANKRGGKQLAEIDVFPVEARFYEQRSGAEDIKPTWVRKFS